MALATYSDLVTEVQAWTKRTDLAAKVPDFIRLAEVRMKSILTFRMSEKTVNLATVQGVDSVTLPTDFKEPIVLWLAQYTDRDPIEQMLVEDLPYSTTPEQPRYWGPDDSVIRFAAPADQVWNLKFRYIPTYELTQANPNNPVMTKYPDCYLFGTLFECAAYIFDDAASAKWNAMFLDAVKRANRQEGKTAKRVNLRTELGAFGSSRFDIRRGY